MCHVFSLKPHALNQPSHSMAGVYVELLRGGKLGAIVWVQVEWEAGGWWWKSVLVRFFVLIAPGGRIVCDHIIEDGGEEGKWWWEPDWNWADWSLHAPQVRRRTLPY